MGRFSWQLLVGQDLLTYHYEMDGGHRSITIDVTHMSITWLERAVAELCR